jgi:AcrR family transcriptional regulator
MLLEKVADRRRRNRAEVVDAILAAGRAVMREQGVAALNLNEVARRVGMRTPSLYGYFDGKMALYDALFALGARLFRRRVDELAARALPPSQQLRAGLELYMGFALEQPELYQLVFERPVPGFVPSEAALAESLAALAATARMVEGLIAAGAMAPGLPVEQARDLLIAVTHGLTALHLANEPHLPIGTGRFGSLIPAAAALFGSDARREPTQEREPPA